MRFWKFDIKLNSKDSTLLTFNILLVFEIILLLLQCGVKKIEKLFDFT